MRRKVMSDLPKDNSEIPDDPEILEQFKLVEEIRQQLVKAKEELVKRIVAFQNSCNHDLRRIEEFDPEYTWGLDTPRHSGDTVLKGWRCKNCCIFKPKNQGLPWQICYKCGGRMQHIDIIHDQGRNISRHQCEKCGHLIGYHVV